MTTITIALPNIVDVKNFVNIVMHFNFDVDLISGRYAVDAKSIMGIFSLDLTKPITLKAHTTDSDLVCKALADYIVK